MTVEYKLDKEDFLAFQLFVASQSERIRKRKVISLSLMAFNGLVFSLLFYVQHNLLRSIIIIAATPLLVYLYYLFIKWRYVNHYRKHTQETCAKRLGQPVKLEFHSDYIFSKDKTGESKINLSEVEHVSETQLHFFIKVSSGVYIIIPKSEIQQTELLLAEFTAHNLRVIQHLNWKW